jgi:hypothetical protein
VTEKYKNKTTVSLTDDQNEMLSEIARESRSPKTAILRSLIELCDEAGGVSAVRDAVDQYDSMSNFEYELDSFDGILPREWFRDHYERGTPIDPDHVEKAELPQKSTDKAAVVYGMLIHEGVPVFEDQEDNKSDKILSFIWQYLGMTDTVEDTYTTLLAKMEMMYGDHQEKVYTLAKRKYEQSEPDDEALEIIAENKGSGPVYRAAMDILAERDRSE